MRTGRASSLEDLLAGLIFMGDDRAVERSFIAGQCVSTRDADGSGALRQRAFNRRTYDSKPAHFSALRDLRSRQSVHFCSRAFPGGDGVRHRPGSGQLRIEVDDAAKTRVTIETDSISTSYYSFGTVIGGKPEIFIGSAGLANVRLSDRIQVRGPALRDGVYRGDRITLVGREVPASQVGRRNDARSGAVRFRADRHSFEQRSARNTSKERSVRSTSTRDGSSSRRPTAA